MPDSSNQVIRKRVSAEPAPASSGQERLWFIHQMDPGNPAYNVVAAWKFSGPLDPVRLETCLEALVARHEVLRTTYRFDDGQLLQVIAPEIHIALPIQECDRAALNSAITLEAARPFDLALGPVIRALLFRLDPSEHVLVLTVHHIATDGWSTQILLEDLAALYSAATSGETAQLVPLPIQYADFAIWQRDVLHGDGLSAQVQYWKEQLAGELPLLDLQTDHPRPAVQTFRGARISKMLPVGLNEQLKSIGRRERTSLFMVLLSAFNVLLARYTQQEDLLVGVPIAGRTRTDTERIVGFLVNSLVLRTDLSGAPTFRELLARVRRASLQAFSHQDVPFEKLVEVLQPERNQSRTPLYQVMFQLRNVPKRTPAVPGLEISALDVDLGIAKFDLILEFTEKADGLLCMLEYNADLFTQAAVQRMLQHLENLLHGITSDPDTVIWRLPLLSPEERSQLCAWNNTFRDQPSHACIHTLFEQQAGRNPDAIAASFEGEDLTYSDLNTRANAVAHFLHRKGVRAGDMVGLCVQQSPQMIVGMLGILKAGAAYVPLDPAYPRERLEFMVRDAGVGIVLSQRDLLQTQTWDDVAVTCLDADWESIARESVDNPASTENGESIAYVIYTSGSTGQPKGVTVPHRAVIRLVVNTDYIELNAADVVAQAANSAFDAATFEIWGALLNGARLAGIAQNVMLSPSDLQREIEARGITVMFLTTAVFNQMARTVPAAFRSLRVVLFGGEACTPQCVSDVLQHGAPGALLHVYGPTETTTFATWYRVSAVAPDAVTIPIGHPIANTTTYVLDRHMNQMPVGAAGELYIAGPGLATGYLNRPELTAERFIRNPLVDDPEARLYKTGDKVRCLPEGELEFLGRFDEQVKIRGWRIEPEEIARALAEHPDLSQALVVVREDQPGDKRLVAYIVARGKFTPSTQQVRDFLRGKLPEYMLPAAVVPLPSIPLTANGKLDKRVLPVPGNDLAVSEDYLGPRDPLQYQLVQIWEDLLGVHPISVRASFFEIGGHSLLAVKMVDRIERNLGRKLPLATLFAGSTIELVANALLPREGQTRRSGPVQVQAGIQGRPPFVFLHGDFVTGGFYCRELAAAMGPDQPFYVMQPHGLDGSEVPATVEEMAADHLLTLRAFQPQGPYLLGGHCNGGVIAFEIARQLAESGEEVRFLSVVHGWAGRAYTGFDKEWDAGPWNPTAEDLNSSDYYKRRGLAYHRYTRALWVFSPARYQGRISLFWPEDEEFKYHDCTAGWGKVAANVEIYRPPGDHLSSITTHVRQLGVMLRDVLDRTGVGS